MSFANRPYSFWTYSRIIWYNHRGVVAMVALAGLLLVLATFWRVRNTTNTRSRIITVERLVEKGTWAHVAPGDTTPFELSIDAVMVGDRMYSSKPPLYPLLMAAEGIVFKAVTGHTFYAHLKDYIRLFTLLNQVFPFLLMLWILLTVVRYYTDKEWTLYMMTLLMTLSSLVYGYAVTINNHTPAAIALVLAAWMVWVSVWQGSKGAGWMLVAGLLAGWSVAIDLPGIAIAGMLWLAVVIRSRPAGVWMGVGMVLPLMASAAIFYHLTGEIRPIYMQQELYDYTGSYWVSPEANDTLADPWWLYLFHAVIGHNGLISLTPALLFGIIGYVWMIRVRKGSLATSLLWIGPGMVAIVLFVLLGTHNYGGYCIGMRWWIIIMPFLQLAALPVIDALAVFRAGRVITVAALVLSLPAVVQALYHDAFIRSFLEVWWLDQH